MSVTPNFDAFIEYLKDTSFCSSDYKFNSIFIEINNVRNDGPLLESLILKLIDDNIIFKDVYEEILEGDDKTKKQQWNKIFYELQDRYFELYNKYFYDSDNIINGNQLLFEKECLLDDPLFGKQDADFLFCITRSHMGPDKRKIIDDHYDKLLESLLNTSEKEKLDFILLKLNFLKKYLNTEYHDVCLSIKNLDDLAYNGEQVKDLEESELGHTISFVEHDGKLYDEEDIYRWTVFNDFLNYYSFLQDKYYKYSNPKSYYLFHDPIWDNLLNRIIKEIEPENWNIQEFAVLTRFFMSKKKLRINISTKVMEELEKCNLGTKDSLKRFINNKPLDAKEIKPHIIDKIKRLSEKIISNNNYYTEATRIINSIKFVNNNNNEPIKDINLDGIKKLFYIDEEPTDIKTFNVFDDLHEINT